MLILIIELIFLISNFTILLIIFRTHPLVICLLLLAYSFSVRIQFVLSLRFWLSLAVNLIFLGGIIVIFIYLTSVVENEKLLLSHFMLRFYVFGAAQLLFLIIPLNHKLYKKFSFIPQLFTYSKVLLIILTCYLLFSLFIVVKITESFQGSLLKNFLLY